MPICNLDHIKVWEIKDWKFQVLWVNPRFLKIIAFLKNEEFSKFLGNVKIPSKKKKEMWKEIKVYCLSFVRNHIPPQYKRDLQGV